jgi:peptidoglycan/xylan/chitin deacetylase (PgdA/CDA1 family)
VNRELYRDNTPERFWRVLAEAEPTPAQWAEAISRAATVLPPEVRSGGDEIDTILVRTLGEGQFGDDHWRIGRVKRAYNMLKPILPRALTRPMKRVYGSHRGASRQLGWPIENRYGRFQFEVVRNVLEISGSTSLPFIDFWPHAHKYAFVLTHDIETAAGQAFASQVADLDAAFGFRSSFNFVPERYRLDRDLIAELRARGFEIGVHGLRHDGKDFSSLRRFNHRAALMNRYLSELDAVGFRSPLTHRNPEWMQALEIEYDGSFFDTDPYEPIAGGTMSIWPFRLGRFLELPYTLTQDYTLVSVLGETTPRRWLEKVEFIRAHRGMALLNTHPDYLRTPQTWKVYSEFLSVMSGRADYYHALPREVARWWGARAVAPTPQELPGGAVGAIDSRVCEAITEWAPASQSGRCASGTEDARSSAERIA